MILIINTALVEKTLVGVAENGKLYKRSGPARDSSKILVLLDNLLKKRRKGLDNLEGVVVVTGPGSFTSIRQGVVVANTLAFLLKIPVAGIKLDEFKDASNLVTFCLHRLKEAKVGKMVKPYYDREPNITKPKKKF